MSLQRHHESLASVWGSHTRELGGVKMKWHPSQGKARQGKVRCDVSKGGRWQDGHVLKPAHTLCAANFLSFLAEPPYHTLCRLPLLISLPSRPFFHCIFASCLNIVSTWIPTGLHQCRTDTCKIKEGEVYPFLTNWVESPSTVLILVYLALSTLRCSQGFLIACLH